MLKFGPKRNEAFYLDNSYNFATSDSFRISRFRSQEPNTKLDRLTALFEEKITDWDIDWRNFAGCFWEVQVWILIFHYPMDALLKSINKNCNRKTRIEVIVVEERFASKQKLIDTSMERVTADSF